MIGSRFRKMSVRGLYVCPPKTQPTLLADSTIGGFVAVLDKPAYSRRKFDELDHQPRFSCKPLTIYCLVALAGKTFSSRCAAGGAAAS
jgi:hypothetical protein